MSLIGRMAISLGAAALVAVTLINVAFVVWSHTMIAEQRMERLRISAMMASALVATENAQREFSKWNQELGVVVTTLDRQGNLWQSRPIAMPKNAQQPIQFHGFVHLEQPQPNASAYSRVVVSIATPNAVTTLLDMQRWALLVLFGAVLVFVGCGLLFLRRVIVHPVEHLIGLVGSRDYDGLAAFGDPAQDRLAALGRTIGSMTRRIDDDKIRLKKQVTQLQTTQNELEVAHHQFVRAERLAASGELAAGLAHEIGNPLAIVRGYVDVLATATPRDDDEAKALRRMSCELDRIHSTVRTLLDYTRTGDTATGCGDVHEAVTHVLELLKPQKRMRHMSLRVHLPKESMAIAIKTDALTQVLVNLMLNAGDAVVDQGTVWVSGTLSDGITTIMIDDDGPGIDEERRSHIFEPFFTTKPAGKGTGLGLWVSQRIVTKAGGELSYAHRTGGGSRFIVRVPTTVGQPMNK